MKKKKTEVRQPKKTRDWLVDVSKGVPVREFKPLQLQQHPRAEEMQAYAAMPSWHP